MVTLKVKGMTCGHCVSSVSKAIQKVDGVSRVDVNLARGEVAIEGTPELDAVVAAVREAGYEASHEAISGQA